MRRATLFVCSTAHIPATERALFERLISTAPRRGDGRIALNHISLVIEPYAHGWFIHTSAVFGDGDPLDISPELRAILDSAAAADASWVLFDSDEPPCDLFPVFGGNDRLSGDGHH